MPGSLNAIAMKSHSAVPSLLVALRELGARLGFALAAVFLLSALAFSQGSDKVVKAQGFASVERVAPQSKFKLAVVLEVADGYHINAHVPTMDYLIPTNVVFQSPAGIRVSEPLYPPPLTRMFEFAPQAQLAVHEGRVIITADAEAEKNWKDSGSGSAIVARLTVQSCSERVCLAPARLQTEIPIRFAKPGETVPETQAELFKEAARQLSGTPPATVRSSTPGLVQFGGTSQPKNPISGLIESRGMLFTLLFVFISGLALNTTPCVYPIIPITIGFFTNQSQGKTGGTFLMSATYVLGMAITYSLLGVVASMSQGLFGGLLQNPWVLIGLALLMLGLALSMFGVYEFRLPSFLNRFADKSTQSAGGTLRAFLMGLMMGIVAAPCIGPFVLGLLVHVGAKGDPVYGFFMFFVLSLGLGLPYLFLGTFSGALKRLPRSGEWMVTVRKVFGLVLIGMALYFVAPLLGKATKVAFVAFFLSSAAYLIAVEARRVKANGFAWGLRALGLGSLLAAGVMILPEKVEAGIEWQPYSAAALASAQREGKPVIIDAFADWCIPCKELDRFTFTHAEVRRQASEFVTLKLDLTRNEPNSEEGRTRERFGILGVPTIIFLDASGQERKDLRLEGFEKAEGFLTRMKEVAAQPRVARASSAIEAPPTRSQRARVFRQGLISL
jgi:thiol:disulfide interchange protein DsbD